MSPLLIVFLLLGYFALLWAIATYFSRGGSDSNDVFFRGERRSPWAVVAFGMIGASITGVSFVSVPGMVAGGQMGYLQMCMGFFVGYIIVARLLLPLYYRLGLTSIYAYLGQRFGGVSHRTGTLFFVVSKLLGASLRFYVTCAVLQTFVFDALGIPFVVSVSLILALVWVYTHRAGIRALVFTDALQTALMLIALIAMLYMAKEALGLSVGEAITAVQESPYSRVFFWDDWLGKQHFVKQFLSGVFIVIVMTGLDQDMMQKNLTTPNLRLAQRNMCSYGLAFLPVNLLFLTLGALLYLYATTHGLPLPAKPDELLPLVVQQGILGSAALVCFVLGVVSAAFSSVDSSLTALTTTACVDLFRVEERGLSEAKATRWRQRTHVVVIALFLGLTLLFRAWGNGNILDALYTLVGYTYGPLLGLFAYGIFTTRPIRDRYVPLVCLIAPLLCYALSIAIPHYTGYTLGYELLLLNGLLTALGLHLLSRRA